MFERATALLLALCCAVSGPARAAAGPPSEASALRSRGESLAGEGRYREAAETLARALEAMPLDASHREQRNQLASEMITAYRLAYEAAPNECALLSRGLAQADRYVDWLRDSYGRAAQSADDYGQVARLRAELEQMRVSGPCAEPVAEEQPGTPAPAEGPSEAVEVVPQPAPIIKEPRRSLVRPFIIGIGASGGLALIMMIGAVVAYSKVPDQGARAGAATMGVLAGASVVSAGVFTGLLIREQRDQSRLARAWRRYHVQVGAGPRAGGAALTAGFSF